MTSYRQLRSQLCADVAGYLHHAQEFNWQFLHEPHDALAPDDVRNWPELGQLLARVEQRELVKECLNAAVQEQLWPEAMAAALVLDRYVYRHLRTETEDLLSLVDQIAKGGDTQVPLQLQIRRGRVLRDNGYPLEAVQHLDDLMARIESGQAKATDSEQKAVKARSMYIKAEIGEMLGLWQQAASDLVKAIAVLRTFRRPDPKNTSYCFQVLSQILRSSSHADYEQLKVIISFEEEDPYLQAYHFNRHAALLISYDSFHFSRHQHSAGTAMLLYCLAGENSPVGETRKTCLKKAIDELKLSIRAQTFQTVLDTSDQTHDFAFCLHSLGIAYRELGDEFLSLSSEANKLSKRIYEIFQNRGSMRPVVEGIDRFLMEIDLDPIQQKKPYNEEYILRHISDKEERQHLRDPTLIDNSSPSVRVPVLLQQMDFRAETPQYGRGDSNEAEQRTGPVLSSPVPAYGGAACLSLSRDIPSFTSSCHESQNERAKYPSRPVDDNPLLAPVAREKKSLLKLSSKLSSRPTSVSRIRPSVNKSYVPIVTGSMGIVPGTEEHHFVRKQEESEQVGERAITVRGVRDALVYQYRPMTDDWIYWRTLAYVGTGVSVQVKGGTRNLVYVKFLQQPDYKATLVAKYYSWQQPPQNYLSDVIKQELARYLVMQFDTELTGKHQIHPQVDTLPVWHLQILDDKGAIEEYVNVEQYIGSGYRKITDAYGGVSESSPNKEFLTSLSHYTWQRSKWKLLINDIQGWEQCDHQSEEEAEKNPKESRRIILTDPGIATIDELLAQNCGTTPTQGQAEFNKFWKGKPESHGWTHESNKYCKSLNLEVPPEAVIEDA